MDVVILAASAALNVNLYILSRNRVEDTITLIKAPVQNSTQSLILKYNRSGGSYHGFDHYQPIIRLRSAIDCSNVAVGGPGIKLVAPSSSLGVSSASTNPTPSSSVPSSSTNLGVSTSGTIPLPSLPTISQSDSISISSTTPHTATINSQQVTGTLWPSF